MYLESTPLSVEEVMAVWVQQEPIPPPLTNKDTQSGGIVYSEEAEAEPLPQQWVAQVVPQGGTDLYTLYGAVGKLIITRERADRYSLNLIIRIDGVFMDLLTVRMLSPVANEPRLRMTAYLPYPSQWWSERVNINKHFTKHRNLAHFHPPFAMDAQLARAPFLNTPGPKPGSDKTMCWPAKHTLRVLEGEEGFRGYNLDVQQALMQLNQSFWIVSR